MYKRIILKLSGETLAPDASKPDAPRGVFDAQRVDAAAEMILKLQARGIQVGVVIGGGNIWRGREGSMMAMDRATADYMGMLSTVLNALAMQDAIERAGMGKAADGSDIQCRVQTAIEMRQIAEPYIRRRAIRHLEKGRVVIFGCGTGNPFFSTDTAAALRAAEIGADVIFKATNVDGVYDSDPKLNPEAKKYDTLSHIDVLKDGLHVMDSTAASLCMDNSIEILVFNLNDPHNIVKAITGEHIGTIVK